jgi:DNA-directed RNA polymerase subunit F
MVKKPIKERFVSIPEVKDILLNVKEELEKNNEEFGVIQEYTLEHAKRFSKIEADVARKIIDMLMSEYGLSEILAVQVANINPDYIYELKVIFEKDPELRYLSDDKLQEMLYKINDIRDAA